MLSVVTNRIEDLLEAIHEGPARLPCAGFVVSCVGFRGLFVFVRSLRSRFVGLLVFWVHI